MNLFLLRGSAEIFDFTLPWVAGAGGGEARGSRAGRGGDPRKDEGEGEEKLGAAPPHYAVPSPLTLMNLFLLRGSAENFSLEKLEGKSHFF